MRRIRLGRTGIEISEIGLGTKTFGSQTSETEAHEQLDRAVEAGVNFIDTAEMYPTTPWLNETSGLSEQFIGSWLRDRRSRGSVTIATKVTGAGWVGVRDGARLSGSIVREALEGSLKRLGTDHVDLYQLHWPNRGSYHFRRHWRFDPRRHDVGDMEQEIADILGEAGKLISEGKMRAIGVANETAWGTMKFLAASGRNDLPRIASIQNEYSLLCRLFDTDLAELAVREDVTLLAYSPLAGGLLSAKYVDAPVGEGTRRSIDGGLNGRVTQASTDAVAAYAEVAGRHGLAPVVMAIAFCLSRPFPVVPIMGATSTSQLEINLSASGLKLAEEVLADIEGVRRRYPMPI
jgi:aryl-alcohol dehydrogenase-like predicted oxidoreductase